MDSATGPDICFIGGLPDEILVLIVSQLQVDRGFLAGREADGIRCRKNAISVYSLYALTLTCRKLHVITTPLLYQCVIQNQHQLFIPLLFRTLLHKPELGQHVHYIEFASLDFWELELGMHNQLAKSDSRKYTSCTRNLQWLAPTPELAKDLVWGDEYISHVESTRYRVRSLLRLNLFDTLAFLLSKAVNMQEAALPDQGSILITLSFLKLIKPGKLTRLWLLSRHGSESGLAGNSLRVISANPSGHHSYLAHFLRRTYLKEHMWLDFGPPPPVREISLTTSNACCSLFIQDHLSYCASLEQFSCRWTNQSEVVANLPVLWNIVRKVKSTLTHLTMDSSESAWLISTDEVVPELSSLRDFEALKYLEVSGLVLWGYNDFWDASPLSTLLPECLETLVIKAEWNDDVEDALHQMSIDCTVSLPNLQKVDCSWRPAPGFVADILIDAYQVAGVELILDVEDAPRTS